MTDPLPTYYYLANFRFLIDCVREHYADLMDEQEHSFIERFYQLDRDSQCLLVRMIGRKGPWFRADKLIYTEIENPGVAAAQLLQQQLLTTDTTMSVAELASVITKAELLILFNRELATQKSQRKESLIDTLNELFTGHKSWSQWTNNQFGSLYRLDIQPIISTLLLLFFGNSHQDLTEFVLQDLGLFRYEKYTLDHQHRIFSCRNDIIQHQQISFLREQLASADNLNALIDITLQLPDCFANPIMERRRGRLINQLAYEFERYSEVDTALQLYRQTELPPSRERQIRLLEKSANYPQAWQLLTALIAQPTNEHELQIAERMAPRLAKKVGENIQRKLRNTVTEQHLLLPQCRDDDGNYYRVEEIVRLHLHSNDSPCVYAENELLNGLFGLWLWPEMFRGIRGAFTNPFQMAPLDLYQHDFQQNRPDLQELWTLFEQQDHHQHIKNIWQQKQGLANHFVNWQFLDEATLEIALQCIPAQHLKLIFQRLLFDLKANRSGLPDLIQFFPATTAYRMIEVKGPGDRIQDNQQRWLDFFICHNIPAEVCYVSWK